MVTEKVVFEQRQEGNMVRVPSGGSAASRSESEEERGTQRGERRAHGRGTRGLIGSILGKVGTTKTGCDLTWAFTRPLWLERRGPDTGHWSISWDSEHEDGSRVVGSWNQQNVTMGWTVRGVQDEARLPPSD